MKIETIKDFGANRANSAKQNASNSFAPADNAVGEEFDSESSDFASVLENLGNKEKSVEPKKTDALKEKERDDQSNDRQAQTKRSFQDNSRVDKPQTEAGNADAAAAVNARHVSRDVSAAEAETPAPPARAMLHIADLERIISTVRTTAFDGQNQVEITLKNSVFSGLKIKLTADENRRVTAEFVAGNEKVRAQIDQRSGELADILRQRGVKLAELRTSVGAETSDQNNAPRNPFEDLTARRGDSRSNRNNLIAQNGETNEDRAANEIGGHTYRV